MSKKKILFPIILATVFLAVAIPVFAYTQRYFDSTNQFYSKICTTSATTSSSIQLRDQVLCFLIEKSRENDILDATQSGQITNHETRISGLENKPGKTILDVQSIRGAFFSTTSNTPVPTGNKVTLNCDITCIFWIDYYADTRNSSNTGAPPSGYNNIYDIYVDGVSQAIFTQASFPVANAAIPLALSGVTCCHLGSHTVEIYAHTNGGELQHFESSLQVMAIKE